MPFRIAKSFAVESGHILTKHPGACRFPHGHSRTVEVVLVADTLDGRDMVTDFKALKLAVGALIERFDHSLALNTADPQFAHYRSVYGERIIPFEGVDPTSEVMAQVLYAEIKRALANAAQTTADSAYPIRGNVRLEKVRVTETASSWAEYWE